MSSALLQPGLQLQHCCGLAAKVLQCIYLIYMAASASVLSLERSISTAECKVPTLSSCIYPVNLAPSVFLIWISRKWAKNSGLIVIMDMLVTTPCHLSASLRKTLASCNCLIQYECVCFSFFVFLDQIWLLQSCQVPVDNGRYYMFPVKSYSQ